MQRCTRKNRLSQPANFNGLKRRNSLIQVACSSHCFSLHKCWLHQIETHVLQHWLVSKSLPTDSRLSRRPKVAKHWPSLNLLRLHRTDKVDLLIQNLPKLGALSGRERRNDVAFKELTIRFVSCCCKTSNLFLYMLKSTGGSLVASCKNTFAFVVYN